MSAVLFAEPVAAIPIASLFEQLQRSRIRIPRPAEVREYVTIYPDLIPVVQQVCVTAAAEFDGRAELSLELYADPEIDDQYLTIYVRRDSYDDATWEAIERIRESYEDEIAELSGWLHVTVDFRVSIN